MITVNPSEGYTVVGGGMKSRATAFNKLAVFEESMPEHQHWRCDIGAGPGRLDCFVRACRFQVPVKCKNVKVSKAGSGVRYASCPSGYTVMDGGLYNKRRSYKNKNSGFEGWWIDGTRNRVGGDAGFGSGAFNVYARCCNIPKSTKCVVRSHKFHLSAGGVLSCPSGYTVTGGGVVNHIRNKPSASNMFMAAHPHGRSAYRCKTGLGKGTFTCYARCCKF